VIHGCVYVMVFILQKSGINIIRKTFLDDKQIVNDIIPHTLTGKRRWKWLSAVLRIRIWAWMKAADIIDSIAGKLSLISE
jgi:hypothetical protein